MPGPAAPHRRDNAFAHERDAKVCWLLDMHPVTADILVNLGLFPSKNKALKRLNRLTARKRIRLIGTISRKAGRPEQVYCRWRPKLDQLLHEIELTMLCLRIDSEKIQRGPHVSDQQVRPDAEVWIGGQAFYLELDRGSMSYAQLSRRFRKYEGCPLFSLWVCPTEDRRDGMRQRAQSIRHTALFTTFAEAITTPHGEIWLDVVGGRVALPRQGEEKGG